MSLAKSPTKDKVRQNKLTLAVVHNDDLKLLDGVNETLHPIHNVRMVETIESFLFE